MEEKLCKDPEEDEEEVVLTPEMEAELSNGYGDETEEENDEE